MSEDYSVFCESDFDGSLSFSTSRFRKASKQHKCDECHGSILLGERYEYTAGKQDGDMWDNKTCPRCLALVDWIKAYVPCYCRMYGALFEDERMPEMVGQARHTPGFAFGILRRIVAINHHRYGKKNCTSTTAEKA